MQKQSTNFFLCALRFVVDRKRVPTHTRAYTRKQRQPPSYYEYIYIDDEINIRAHKKYKCIFMTFGMVNQQRHKVLN